MKCLMRRLSRVADSSQCYATLPPSSATAKGIGAGGFGQGRVPEGHVPVCVGEEKERFTVRAELLGRPAFLELLRRSAQEYGFEQHGVLRIPVPVPLFRRLLLLLVLSSDAGGTDPALDELFRSPTDEIRSPGSGDDNDDQSF